VTSETFDYALGARALARHVKEKMLAHEKEDWRFAQQGKAFWHNIRSLYNYRGARVESYIAWKLRLDPIYRHIDEIVPVEGFILDLGCGFGLMANILARKSLHRHVMGVDFDKAKIEIASGTVPIRLDTSFEIQDIREWEYPKADTVLLIDVLHYWSEETQESIIEKVGACLPEGGTVIFRDALSEGKWRHRLTAWSEVFSTKTGQNRRGDTLCFRHRDFYLSAFEHAGLKLFSEPPNLGRGSNAVLIFRKERR
jgi:SAM-dependent methyltransferase